MGTDFPILMYHALWPPIDDAAGRAAHFAADPQLADPGARLYALDARVFARQLDAIVAAGGAGAPPDAAGLDDPRWRRGAWITFDDGHRSNLTLALPELAARRLRAIFFITTGWTGTPGFLTEEEIGALAAAGMIVGAHGVSHRYLSDLSDAELAAELRDSRARLESMISAPVTSVALPGGRNSARVRKAAAAAGYRHLFTSRIAAAGPAGDPLDWPRVPILNTQPAEFLPALLRGDRRALAAMARSARLRQAIRSLLGNHLYDRLRSRALGG